MTMLLSVSTIAVVVTIAILLLAPTYASRVVLLWCVNAAAFLLPIATERVHTGSRVSRLDWFSPLLYELPLYYTGMIRPLFIIANDWQTSYMIGGEERVGPVLIKTMILSIAANLARLFGYYLRLGEVLGRRTPSFRISVESTAMRVGLGAVLLVAAGAYILVMVSAGGLIQFVNNLSSRRALLEGQNYLLVAILLLPLPVWIRLAVQLRKSAGKPWRYYFACLLAATVLSTLGGRGYIVQVFIVAVCVYNYTRRRIPLLLLLALSVVGANFAYFYLQVRMSTNRGYLNEAALSKTSSFAERMFSEAEGIDRTLVVVEGVPEAIPYQFFATYTRLVTTLIPRQWYPDKPALSEASVYAPLFGGSTNIGIYPAGTVGDFYLQCGFVGVLIGAFAGGIVRRAGYAYLRANVDCPLVVVTYGIALSSGAFNLRNLGLLDFAERLIPIVGLVLLAGHRVGAVPFWRAQRATAPVSESREAAI